MEQKSALEGNGKKSRKCMIMKGEIVSHFNWDVFPFRTRFSLWYGLYRVKFNLHSYNKEIRSRPMDVSM